MKIRQLTKLAYRLFQDEDGPTAVEYAVMISLIIGACFAAVGNLSNAARDSFDSSAEAIEAAMGGP